MTKEEAKEILTHNWTRVDNPNYSESELDEAFFMAIEALSAEEAVWKEYEAEFTDLPDIPRYYYEKVIGNMAHEISMLKEQLESADAIRCSLGERRKPMLHITYLSKPEIKSTVQSNRLTEITNWCNKYGYKYSLHEEGNDRFVEIDDRNNPVFKF